MTNEDDFSMSSKLRRQAQADGYKNQGGGGEYMVEPTKKDSIKKSKLASFLSTPTIPQTKKDLNCSAVTKNDIHTPTIPQKELTEQIEEVLDAFRKDVKRLNSHVAEIGMHLNFSQATSQLLDIVNQARVEELNNYRSMIFQFGKWRKLGIEMSEEEVNDRIKELEGKTGPLQTYNDPREKKST